MYYKKIFVDAWQWNGTEDRKYFPDWLIEEDKKHLVGFYDNMIVVGKMGQPNYGGKDDYVIKEGSSSLYTISKEEFESNYIEVK
jgi:hypothetical protein